MKYMEIDVELIALGAVIVNHNQIDRWKLRATDFANLVNRHVFEIVEEHHRRGESITQGMIEAMVDADEMADDEFTVRQQIRFAVSFGIQHATPGTGERLREIAAKRAVNQVGYDLRHGAIGDQSAEAMLESVKGNLERIVDRASDDDSFEMLGDVGAEIVQDIMDGVVPEEIFTGSQQLTRRLGGYQPGELIIIAGRPSMGKSMVAQSLGLQMAKKGIGVVMFSLEMSAKELGYRSLSDLMWTSQERLSYQNIRNRDLNDNQVDLLGQAGAHLQTLPFVVDDRAGLSLDEIGFEIRKHKQRMARTKTPLKVVFVDHIGHVKPSDRYKGNKTNEVGEVSAGLLKLAKDLDITIVGLCQLNRGPESREEKRPSLADLRNSGDIEQDANTVMFVYRDAYYIERQNFDDEREKTAALDQHRNKLEILIAKNRRGSTETVHLFCDPACNVIRDIERPRA